MADSIWQKRILQNMFYGYSLARSAHFAAQGALLPWVGLLATGEKRKKIKSYPEHLKAALPKIRSLLKADAENIVRGLYPAEVLRPEGLLTHSRRLPKVFLDAAVSARRRQKRNAQDFGAEAREFLAELPEYYTRNFHYQTGGYLSDHSAALYDHQVEMLFAGTADAMRRLPLPDLKKRWPGAGRGLRFLEIGCGTGRLTKFMALAYPQAEITALDISPFYLATARENLRGFPRVSYVKGAGENLDFRTGTFDLVYSCFLFHELPLTVRRQVLAESARVLKPDGRVGFIDSLQIDDDKSFNWALRQFPRDFHEPFYKNYVQNPIEGLLRAEGLKPEAVRYGFLSKAVLASKAPGAKSGSRRVTPTRG